MKTLNSVLSPNTWAKRSADNENPATKIYGFSPLAIGMKLKLADEKGFWPQAALIGHVNLRAGSKEFEPEYTSGQFRLTFAHTLNENFALSYNVGAEWNGFTPGSNFYLYAFPWLCSQ